MSYLKLVTMLCLCVFPQFLWASVHGIELKLKVGNTEFRQQAQAVGLQVDGQSYVVTTSFLRTSQEAEYFLDGDKNFKAQLIAHDFQRGLVLLKIDHKLEDSPKYNPQQIVSFNFKDQKLEQVSTSMFATKSLRHPFSEVGELMELQAPASIGKLAGAALTDKDGKVIGMISSYALEFKLGGVYKLKPVDHLQKGLPARAIAYPLSYLVQWIRRIQNQEILVPQLAYTPGKQVILRWPGIELTQNCLSDDIGTPLGGNDGAGIGGGGNVLKFLNMLDTEFSKEQAFCQFTFKHQEGNEQAVAKLPPWLSRLEKQLREYETFEVSYFYKNLGEEHYVGGEIKNLRNLFYIAHDLDLNLALLPTETTVFKNSKITDYLRAGNENWHIRIEKQLSKINDLVMGMSSAHSEYYYGLLLHSTLQFDSEPYALFKNNVLRKIEISEIEDHLNGNVGGGSITYFENLKLQLEIYPFTSEKDAR